ncbi:MAG: hypothetical protein K8H88_08735 [Sandaracinaceae bacterium]|nr:hypothetical protein [Sandaracinaceae bacterium]
MRRLLYVSLLWIGCGGTSHVADGGADSGSVDAGQIDAGQIDAGGRDGGAIDAGRLDGGFSCEAMDAREGEPCGPTEDPAIRFLWDGTSCAQVAWCHCVGADCGALFSTRTACEAAYAECLGGPCASDADCTPGARWCEGGRCVLCDNSGLLCDIFCPLDWRTYERNGCFPCECAPTNDCVSDGDCVPAGRHCYYGAFCWCDPPRPDCCMGNHCSPAGCTEPAPGGCRGRGCPRGLTCDPNAGCAPSGCGCDGSSGAWGCTTDCNGGTCVEP